MSSPSSSLHSQLASIMEVLANAAVAEICQLVDDSFSSLRMEVSRCRRENRALKTRMRLSEVRAGPQDRRGPRTSTWTREGRGVGEQSLTTSKSSCLQSAGGQQSKPVDAVDQEANVRKEAVELEVVAVKMETLSEDQESSALSCSVESLSLFPAAAESLLPLNGAAHNLTVNPVGCFDNLDQQTKALSSHQEDLCGTSEEDRGLCAVSPSVSGSKAVDAELPLNSADWTSAVKLETYPSWSEVFSSHRPSDCVGSEYLSSNGLTDTKKLQTDGEVAQIDAGCLDASFNDLFSSQEASMSLSAPHRPSTLSEDPLLPFSFRGTSGILSTSNCQSGFRECSNTEQTFSCSQCGRLFSSSRDLLVHQRFHTGQRIYHCSLCRKPFVHPHQLKTHQRVHTGEKPFSCFQCGKRFSQSSHIKRHMSVHTGEKRYSCSLCGKRFSQACSLKVHQAVHTGERPYRCTTCGKSFSVLGNLVRHQSVHISK